MSQIVIDIPESSLSAMKVTANAAGDQLRLLAAMKLYELGEASSGVAAELAGISRVAFLSRLGEFGVPAFSMTEEEVREDLSNA
jgi:predicted HTH domain antitoxin